MRIPASLGRSLAAAAAALILVIPSEAYYHYIHFNGRNYAVPIYEKFDLSALPNNTVTFFVSDQTPRAYAPNDSLGSVLSQVKEAAAVWNNVPSSDLRVAFGGMESQNQLGSSVPGGDVIFIDLPPGVLGMGAPTTGAMASGPNGSFFPILHSTVMLSRDTNAGAGASYLENFFTTAVHEIGHALGLQHTWTGSAMSQGVVRDTFRTRPLDADDVAGLSVLYGKPGWTGNFGAIAGRVTFANGAPVALGSVVAIAPTGAAVSTLTNPDGTYHIDGIPPGSYLVYVHPLPPDGVANGEGLRLPVDLTGTVLPASGLFQTVFHRGSGTTLDPQSADVIPVGTDVVPNINFSVQARSSIPTYDVVPNGQVDTVTRQYVTMATSTTIPVVPAFLDTTQRWGVMISHAADPAFLPMPQSVTILGGFAPAAVTNREWPLIWSLAPGQVGAVFGMPLSAGSGPRHLVYNFGNDLYVLPNGVNLVQSGAPEITAVTPNSDGTVTITGAGLNADSKVYFDGLKAAEFTAFDGTDAQGSVTVTPPVGAPGQVSTITVYNSDGQNSMILQGQNASTYTYPAAAVPQIATVKPATLAANSSAAIEITTQNATLVDGRVTVGFGTDDISVRRVWVLDPNHIVANIVVAPNATPGATQVSVISGFQVMAQDAAFTTTPARGGFPALNLPVVNTDANQHGLYPGSTARIVGTGLSVSGGAQVNLNDTPLQVQSQSDSQITFMLPANIAPGMAMLTLNNGVVSASPVAVQIDAPPAVIVSITNAADQTLLGSSVGSGDLLNVIVSGMDPGVVNDLRRVRVTAGGVDLPVQKIAALPNGLMQIEVTVSQGFSNTQVPLQVLVDGSGCVPVTITIR